MYGIKLFRNKKVYTCICRLGENTWQGWQSIFQTFEDDDDLKVEEIRELLDDVDRPEANS